MKTVIVSAQPAEAGWLLIKLRHLTLLGSNAYGLLEWEGSSEQMIEVSKEEDKYG